VDAPPPTRVWLYEPGGPGSVRGTLSLEPGGALRFSPRDGETLVILPAEVRSVRRHRLTPVLEIRWERPAGDPDGMAFFYFAEPPTLPEPGEKGDRSPYQILMPNKRHIERSGTLLSMRAASKLLKGDIQRWVQAVRSAGRG
jgi:hypothetical protein